MLLAIVAISILLQCAAACYSLMLIRITGRKHVWMFLCGAFLLMIARRVFSLFEISGVPEADQSVYLINEVIGLIISVLMLLGIHGIKLILVRQKETEKALREFELLKVSALRGKSDPHFLFNTLNSIAYLMSIDREKAEVSLRRLSEMYRFIVAMSDRDVLCLNDELEIVKTYFSFERIRFGETKLNLKVNSQVDGKRIFLPGLTIQPIVENSIKHGFRSRGYGTVAIEISSDGQLVYIVIRDDGDGFGDDGLSSGHGIQIVQARLELCFGDRFTFAMRNHEHKGVITTITIPSTMDGLSNKGKFPDIRRG